MIVLLWLLNLVISFLNAWGCGKSWTETRHFGGMAHFMNWMGAIMAACGFTWCISLVECFIASQCHHMVNGHSVPYLTPVQVMAVASAGYLVIIGPVLGSGLAITIHSWVVFARRRSFANAAIAGYNAWADLYNTIEAFHDVPLAWKGVSKGWNSSDSDGKGTILLLVVFAALAGILLTYTIITVTARNTARDRAFRYAER